MPGTTTQVHSEGWSQLVESPAPPLTWSIIIRKAKHWQGCSRGRSDSGSCWAGNLFSVSDSIPFCVTREPGRPSPSSITAIRFIHMKPQRVFGLMMSMSVSLVREGVSIEVAIHGCRWPRDRCTVRLSRRRWGACPQEVYRLTPQSPQTVNTWNTDNALRIDFKHFSPLLLKPRLLLNSFVRERLLCSCPRFSIQASVAEGWEQSKLPFFPFSENQVWATFFFSVFSLFQDP